MDKHQNTTLSTLNDMATTTEILLNQLSIADEENSQEAISMMLTKGMEYFGPDSTAMRQFAPALDAIKSDIDRTELQQAIAHTETWNKQLHEFISVVKKS